MNDLTFQEVALHSHLVDILTFFVRQHLYRSRNVIHNEALAPRIAQLLKVPQKHLKLSEYNALLCAWSVGSLPLTNPGFSCLEILSHPD